MNWQSELHAIAYQLYICFIGSLIQQQAQGFSCHYPPLARELVLGNLLILWSGPPVLGERTRHRIGLLPVRSY
jgi:hypothetical protein